jgi:hypothetical protein
MNTCLAQVCHVRCPSPRPTRHRPEAAIFRTQFRGISATCDVVVLEATLTLLRSRRAGAQALVVDLAGGTVW